eukprot:15263457-Alexandrium_andersonii.AAC.1
MPVGEAPPGPIAVSPLLQDRCAGVARDSDVGGSAELGPSLETPQLPPPPTPAPPTPRPLGNASTPPSRWSSGTVVAHGAA